MGGLWAPSLRLHKALQSLETVVAIRSKVLELKRQLASDLRQVKGVLATKKEYLESFNFIEKSFKVLPSTKTPPEPKSEQVSGEGKSASRSASSIETENTKPSGGLDQKAIINTVATAGTKPSGGLEKKGSTGDIDGLDQKYPLPNGTKAEVDEGNPFVRQHRKETVATWKKRFKSWFAEICALLGEGRDEVKSFYAAEKATLTLKTMRTLNQIRPQLKNIQTALHLAAPEILSQGKNNENWQKVYDKIIHVISAANEAEKKAVDEEEEQKKSKRKRKEASKSSQETPGFLNDLQVVMVTDGEEDGPETTTTTLSSMAATIETNVVRK